MSEKEEKFEPLLFPRLRKRLREIREERKKGRKQRESSSVENRDITDLVRSQFNFTCPICEEIAEEVSAQFPDRVAKTRIYEAVYKLSSNDKKAQNEAVATLGAFNILKEVMDVIKIAWERLKEKKTE